MSDLKIFQELVDDVWELVFGSVRRPEVKFKNMMYTDKKPKRKRARKKMEHIEVMINLHLM